MGSGAACLHGGMGSKISTTAGATEATPAIQGGLLFSTKMKHIPAERNGMLRGPEKEATDRAMV